MTEESERLSALERHIRRFWDGHIMEAATWDHGPILERVPHFATYRVYPQRAGEAWVYVTVGSSLHGSAVGRFEFFVMSPLAADIQSETLAMVSYFHSSKAHQLSVGSVVNLGRPWMPDSRMDHLLVSLPYPYGPKLEWSSTEAGGARFLWLLPVYKSEADFIKRETLENFESMLDAEGVDVLDPSRNPVI